MPREPRREPLVSKIQQDDLDPVTLRDGCKIVKVMLVWARSLSYRRPLHIGGSDVLHMLASSCSTSGRLPLHVLPMYEEVSPEVDKSGECISFEHMPVSSWVEPGDQIAILIDEDEKGASWLHATDLEEAIIELNNTVFYRAVSRGHELGHDFILGRLHEKFTNEEALPITFEQKAGPNGDWSPVDPKELETRVAEWQKLGCSRTPTRV